MTPTGKREQKSVSFEASDHLCKVEIIEQSFYYGRWSPRCPIQALIIG